MFLLPSLLVGLLAGSAKSQACVPYAATCANTSMCCNPEAVACLLDVKNNTSCLSPLDFVNLNPALTGLNLLFPPLPGNASAVVKEVVQINGNTVYNVTETVLPNGTAAYGTVSPTIPATTGPSAAAGVPQSASAYPAPSSIATG